MKLTTYGKVSAFCFIVIIFPFGDIGRKFDDILKNVYGVAADYIIDNHLCKYNPRIKDKKEHYRT